MFSKYPLVNQEDLKDCGPACIATLVKYYNGNIPIERLRELCLTTNQGTNALNMIKCLKKIGFNAQGFQIPFDSLDHSPIIYPCIAHVILNQNYHHFIVIYKIDFKKQKIIIGDPLNNIHKISFEYFKKIWDNILISAIPHKKMPLIKENPVKLNTFILSNLKNYKRSLLLIFLTSIIFIGSILAFSFNVGYMVNGINTNETIKYFILGLITFSFISLIKILTDYLKNKLMIKLNKKIDQNITNDIFKKIIHLPYHYYQNRTTGEIFTKINDLNTIKTLISNLILLFSLDIPLLIFSIIILWNLNPTMTLTSIIIVLLFWWLIIIFKNKNETYIKKTQNERAIINNYMFENIKAYKTIKGLGIENNMINQFDNKYQNYLNTKLKFEKHYNFQYLTKELIYSLGPLIILTLGSCLVITNEMTIGELMTFHTLISTFLFSLRNLVDLDTNYKEAKVSLNRVKGFNEKKDKNIKSIIKGKIEIKKLNFSYNGKKVFKNFNCKIKAGNKVMLIGKSGSGKSTFCQLLMKYYKIKDNQIFIDKIDLNQYPNHDIVYINQNEFLFTDTLYNNLTLNRDIDNNELKKIVKMCEIDKIMNNDLGLNTQIEETGFNLSGGQIQQIVLARTLLNKFSVLIIDEGLNQMDSDLERRLLKRIMKKYQDKTIIVVSHRYENKDLFNQIINLDDFN